MILGLSLHAFTVLHVVISLVAILAGLAVLYGMFHAQRMPALTGFFLVTTVLTSLTGFAFPATSVTPAQVVGFISLLLLAAAIVALYSFHLARAWRWIYVASAVFALYLNVFVLVVQSFQKMPLLHPLAPTGSEPPFIVAQAVVLLAFLALGFLAVRRFHPEAILPR